jgi:hypothetical protein
MFSLAFSDLKKKKKHQQRKSIKKGFRFKPPAAAVLLFLV